MGKSEKSHAGGDDILKGSCSGRGGVEGPRLKCCEGGINKTEWPVGYGA